MSRMPKLPFDLMCAGLDDNEARIIRAACNSRTGCLRASKPFGRIDRGRCAGESTGSEMAV